MAVFDQMAENRLDDVAVVRKRGDFRCVPVDDIHVAEIAEVVIFFQIIQHISVVILIDLTCRLSVKKMAVVKRLCARTVKRSYDIIIVVCFGSFPAVVQLVVLDADLDSLHQADAAAVFLLLFFELSVIFVKVEFEGKFRVGITGIIVVGDRHFSEAVLYPGVQHQCHGCIGVIGKKSVCMIIVKHLSVPPCDEYSTAGEKPHEKSEYCIQIFVDFNVHADIMFTMIK